MYLISRLPTMRLAIHRCRHFRSVDWRAFLNRVVRNALKVSGAIIERVVGNVRRRRRRYVATRNATSSATLNATARTNAVRNTLNSNSVAGALRNTRAHYAIRSLVRASRPARRQRGGIMEGAAETGGGSTVNRIYAISLGFRSIGSSRLSSQPENNAPRSTISPTLRSRRRRTSGLLAQPTSH